VAEWAAKGKSTKSCEDCDKLAKQSGGHFAKGVRVRIAEVYDCAKCENYLSRPSQDNENIITLYEALPKNIDGFSGVRTISASDILFLFKIYDVPEELYFDYYHRLMFFHDSLMREAEKQRKLLEKKAKKDIHGLAKKSFSRMGGGTRRR